jgi:hypothetical protein
MEKRTILLHDQSRSFAKAGLSNIAHSPAFISIARHILSCLRRTGSARCLCLWRMLRASVPALTARAQQISPRARRAPPETQLNTGDPAMEAAKPPVTTSSSRSTPPNVVYTMPRSLPDATGDSNADRRDAPLTPSSPSNETAEVSPGKNRAAIIVFPGKSLPLLESADGSRPI